MNQQSGTICAYSKCLQSLLGSECVAGVSLLNAQGCPLYEERVDPCLAVGMEGGVGLVSSREGHQLAEALENLTDDGVCRDGRISCMGTSFQAFGGTPLGIFAVGPGRRVGMIVRALPSVGILVVFYRRPHLPQQVVPCVEKFIDDFWTGARRF